MKVTIAAVGRLKKGAERDLIDEYSKRLPWKIEFKEIEENKSGKDAFLLSAIKGKNVVIALDENGKNIKSLEFAAKIQDWQNDRKSDIAFVIGGADGLSEEVKNKSDFTLSFGKMTWPHMMARAMLVEQLYRAYSILNGHPYHRE